MIVRPTSKWALYHPFGVRKLIGKLSATSACKLVDFLPRDRSISNTDRPRASSAKFRVNFTSYEYHQKPGIGTQPRAGTETPLDNQPV
jgi:hypothetical protein